MENQKRHEIGKIIAWANDGEEAIYNDIQEEE